jgi:DNA-binding NtrC family response regulator
LSDKPIHVLLIDDDALLLRGLEKNLRRAGFNVSLAQNAAEALVAVRDEQPDAALVDYHLPDLMGDELIRSLRGIKSDLICVGFTGEGDPGVADRMLRNGAVDYVDKGEKALEKLTHIFRREVEGRNASFSLDRMRRLQAIADRGRADELVGRAPAMLLLRDAIDRCAKLIARPVLIYGESGSGKERVARAVHAQSGLKGSLVPVNMSTLGENLVDSELFGYERGAFSGADRLQRGLFEVAEDGTLFLDEIGEMPLTQQAKLLRVLADKRIRRVGGTVDIPVNCRVIAATNRDLRVEVQERRFREDLLYRLAGVELRVPPLRERREDIKGLVHHFVHRENISLKRHVKRVDDEVMAALEGYDWARNNVRELERAIEQAMIWVDDAEVLTLEHFEMSFAAPSDARRGRGPLSLGAPPAAPAESTDLVADGGEGRPLPQALLEMPWTAAKDHVTNEFGRRYVYQQLVRANFNITLAASYAGMQRPNFSKLVKSFGIDVERIRHQHLSG